METTTATAHRSGFDWEDADLRFVAIDAETFAAARHYAYDRTPELALAKLDTVPRTLHRRTNRV